MIGNALQLQMPQTQVQVPPQRDIEMQPVQAVAVPEAAQPASNPTAVQSKDTFAQLKEMKELLDCGALTQEEFDAQKKSVLSKFAVHA